MIVIASYLINLFKPKGYQTLQTDQNQKTSDDIYEDKEEEYSLYFKRVICIFLTIMVFIILIIFLYQFYFVPKPKEPEIIINTPKNNIPLNNEKNENNKIREIEISKKNDTQNLTQSLLNHNTQTQNSLATEKIITIQPPQKIIINSTRKKIFVKYNNELETSFELFFFKCVFL